MLLYDHRAREYDPWHGRLCQRDPGRRRTLADLNGDGAVDFGDIDPFVALPHTD